MDLTKAIDIAAVDYRTVVGEPDLTVREFLDAARDSRLVTHLKVEDWADEGAIDAQAAEAYHDVLDATDEQIAGALTVTPVRGGGR